MGGRPFGYKRGDHGSDIPEYVPETMWTAGQTAIVSFATAVNHGGGYQYGLCPKDGTKPTEACFQAHPLQFSQNYSLVYFEDRQDIQKIPAIDVTEGVVPVGAAWRRNPIPAC